MSSFWLFNVVLVMFLSGVQSQITCGPSQFQCGNNCLPGDGSQVCFLTGQVEKQSTSNPDAIYCPATQLACDKACYDPSQFHCNNGQLAQGPEPSTGNTPAVSANSPSSGSQQQQQSKSPPSGPKRTDSPPPSSPTPGTPASPATQSSSQQSSSSPSGGQNTANSFNPSSILAQPPPVSATFTSSSTGGDSFTQPSAYNNLVFADEFNGNSLDRSKWHVETSCSGGGNAEKECYKDNSDVISVKDGYLDITVKAGLPAGQYYQLTPEELKNCNDPLGCATGPDNGGRPFESGRIRSNVTGTTGSWIYGYIAARIKNPSGPFLWPAFWLLPSNATFGTWPHSGEIDIMESKGQYPDVVHTSLQYGNAWPNNDILTSANTFSTPVNDEWHVYGCDWNKDFIDFQLDGQSLYKVSLDQSFFGGESPNPYTANGQPFDQQFHLIFNVAAGGGFFKADDYPNDDLQVAASWTRPTMSVDWVRVWQTDDQYQHNIDFNQQHGLPDYSTVALKIPSSS